MPQPRALLEPVQPTSLRRSPRFFHSPTAPKPRSSNPTSRSSLSSPTYPRNGSTTSRKSSRKIVKFDNRSIICGIPAHGSTNCGVSSNGSVNCGVLANGSGRTTLSGNGGGVEGVRRSSRFRNEVNSSAFCFITMNRVFDKSNNCNGKSNKGILDFVDCPVTLVGTGEKKRKGVLCGEMLGNFEKRVTRSGSTLLERGVEVKDDSQSRQLGCNLFNNRVCEWKTKKVLGLEQPLAVGIGGEVKGRNCSKGKENGSDSCKGVFHGSKNVGYCVGRGGRRGTRNNLQHDHRKDGKRGCSCRQIVENFDKRITRSATKQVGGENDSHCRSMVKQSSCSIRVVGKAGPVEGKKKKGEGSGSFECLGSIQQKKTRHSSMSSAYVTDEEEKATKDIEAKEKESHDCLDVDIPGKGGRKEQDSSRDTKHAGVKRKRNQVGLQGSYVGWTKEQEAALHKAYFTAKPSPDFWKKVAKLVPGKCAQECFDKVHSDNQTPLCTKQTSKTKKQNSRSAFLVSGSKLFNSAETKNKKPCKKKVKSHVARKTVRQLLQKYCHVNQDNETDLFSVLEPSVNSSREARLLNAVQLTPKHLPRSPDSSSKSRERSSGHKERFSRLGNRSDSPLTSPPILKKVKNMALHEKYIDQLHFRESKRQVAFSRCIKSARNQKDGKENSVPMKDIIKSAKDALVFDAKDAIYKFQQSQANILEDFSDSEEFLHSENDEDETVL